MRSTLRVLSVLGLMGSIGWGSVVELTGTPTLIDVAGSEMQVYPQASLTTSNGVVPLKLTGYGIRQKSVAFAKVNVYLATSYVDENISVSPENPIDSLKNAKGRVIILDLLRTMTGQEIRTAFEEALDVNQVDVNAPEVQSLLSQFDGDLYSGDRIVVSSYPNERGIENLIIELPKKNLSESGNLLGLDFWKIWFGEPVDELMAELQSKLIGVKKP